MKNNFTWLIISIFALFMGAEIVESSKNLQERMSRIETEPIITETVLSSWYGEAYQDKLTTSGEPFDRFAHTTAHPSLPFGTLLKLRNPKNGKEVVARVNDRGPYCEYPGSYYYSCEEKRGLDVSEHIAESLGFKQDGVALLEISVLQKID